MGKKQFLAILLAAALAAGLTGCADQAPAPTEPTVQTTAPTVQTTEPTVQTTVPTATTVPVQEAPTTEATEEVSYQAPDFTVYDLDGNAHNLSDYFGKPIVLNFWASWCGPCKMEMPDFEEKYKELGENVQFLMINLTDGQRETVEVAGNFIDSQGYTIPVFYDTTSEAASLYGVYSIPTSYFINAKGEPIAQAQGAIDAETLQRGIDMIS